jgi:hypothetical protein
MNKTSKEHTCKESQYFRCWGKRFVSLVWAIYLAWVYPGLHREPRSLKKFSPFFFPQKYSYKIGLLSHFRRSIWPWARVFEYSACILHNVLSPPLHLLALSESIKRIPFVNKGEAPTAKQQANACLPICSHAVLTAKGVYFQNIWRCCEQTEGSFGGTARSIVHHVEKQPKPRETHLWENPALFPVSLRAHLAARIHPIVVVHPRLPVLSETMLVFVKSLLSLGKHFLVTTQPRFCVRFQNTVHFQSLKLSMETYRCKSFPDKDDGESVWSQSSRSWPRPEGGRVGGTTYPWRMDQAGHGLASVISPGQRITKSSRSALTA